MIPRLRSGQAGALTYLTTRSIRNSVVLRLRRLRQPRYLVVALGLLIYLGSIGFSRSGAPLRIPDNYESWARIGMAIVIFLGMAASWVFGAAAALQFTPAEVNFLFTAPVARRTLLGYKIGRLLLATGGLALFFSLLLGPVRPLAAALFFFKTATIMWVAGLFEAGTSLYRLNAKHSDGAQARLRLPVFLATLALLVLGSWTLAIFAFTSGMQMLRVVPVVMLLVVACIVWILGSDAAFEEEAAINADKLREAIARMQKGQTRVKVRRRGTPYRLAATGPAEFAILWKNSLLFGRLSPSSIALAVLGIVGAGAGIWFAGDALPAWDVVPFFLLAFAGMVVVMGPIMVRSDLRRDMAHLVVLKTWPVRGAAIVRGEILAPAIALSLATIAMLIPAATFMPHKLVPVGETIAARAAFMVASSSCAVALIVTELAIQNGIAVTFPAWVRPKAGGTGAVEGMGIGMIVMYGGVLLMLLAALVPVVVAAVVMVVVGGVLLPSLVFAALLLLESYAATEIVGRILDRTDIQDVG